jgi:replication fork clamp-binding protein CrfC
MIGESYRILLLFTAFELSTTRQKIQMMLQFTIYESKIESYFEYLLRTLALGIINCI